MGYRQGQSAVEAEQEACLAGFRSSAAAWQFLFTASQSTFALLSHHHAYTQKINHKH